MAYLGNAPARSFISFERQVFTIVNSQTAYTLDHSVNNENDIRLVVNNVVQEPGSGKAYTASGTALTLSAATASTDTMYAIYLGRALQTITPSTNSITSGMLGSAFFTGATDVGAAIADADLFLMDDGAGGTLRKTAASRIKTYVGSGLSVADQWRLTTSFQGDADPISSNLEQVDHDGAGKIGSDMTQSSGTFTFPDTGIWYIAFKGAFLSGSGDGANYNFTEILTTIDNSSYSSRNNTAAASNGGAQYMSCFSTTIFDVTDTSTHKVRFKVNVLDSGITTLGNSDITLTGMDFIRLGDT